MNLLFTFSDNTTLSSEFLTDSAKITECYYNELKSADNSASVRIPFNENLCDKIKAEISKNIKVQIKDGNDCIFTGYARKTVSFSKTQRNQPFMLEIVSPAILFDYTFDGNDIRLSNTTLANVITTLLSLSPFSMGFDVSLLEDKEVKFFSIKNGDNLKTIINELLFEYGFCYDFDADGNFYVDRLFKAIPSVVEQKFNGDNCLIEIAQQVKEDKYNRVSIEWTKIEEHFNVLIFEDTTGADSNNPANIDIDANSYYLGEENNYLEYDSKYQKVVWIDSATSTIKYDSNSDITEKFSNLGVKGELSIFNAGTTKRKITELNVSGNGFFEISTNFIKTGSSGREYQYKSKYLQNSEDASYLAKKLCDYYNYSNFNTQITSKVKYDLGSFVEVSDSGIGTLIYRIVKRTWDIKRNIYSYVLESITEYTPVETYTKAQNITSKSDNGETLRDAVADLNTKVDSIVTSATMVSADILSAIIKLDNDGKTIAAQDITTTIRLQQSDVDLDFTIGQINLPAGWSYTINGKQVVFHIEEGIDLRSGQFAIPVLYKTVISEEFFVDENGEVFVDENNIPFVDQVMSSSYTQWNLYFTYFGDNGGVYLGLLSSLSMIPSINNYGDYFTWGADDTVSNLSYDGKFLRGRVYKYVGENKSYKWIQDTNAEHGQAALSDVLYVANSELQKNNSTVYEFLNRLTSNEIYADMIVSNDAFINKITTKIISIGELATVGYVNTETLKAESQALNNTLDELGVSSLQNHTIIEQGKIKTDLINASVIAVGDLKDGNSIINSINSNITNVINGTTSIDVQNAKVNGVTLIEGGYIKASLIDVEQIKATEGFFNDIVVTGTIAGATGRVQNLIITGESHFEGTIDSGPLLLSDASPSPKNLYYPAGSNITQSQLSEIQNANGSGSYGGVDFDTLYFGYSGNVSPFRTRLRLYKNGSEVFSQEKSSSFIGWYADTNLSFTYTIASGSKTFRLINLPDNKPSEVGMIYALSDGILRVVK